MSPERPAPHEAPATPERPVHLRWRYLGVVALGGAVGTGARAALAAAFPPGAGISWTILAINVVGAFCLGLLLEVLAHRGPDVGGRRTLRLLVGTGVLGGFTTYSTLADDTAQLLDAGRWGAGAGYALLSVGLGLVAVAAGVLVAGRFRPSTVGPGAVDPSAVDPSAVDPSAVERAGDAS
ncbi:CrcB family protein [Curtobacterium sp. B8]|uniref:fluoride efflux transporter FluC n=1 Tax=Curtobacterium sp. B8 TaxID=95611 RepID=UPI0003B70924|nr:CrcB family protein [Curtobacterium sp. B8]